MYTTVNFFYSTSLMIRIEPAVHSATSLSPAAMIAMAIFVLGYIGITLEHRYPFHKSALALITGVSVWIVAAAASRGSHIIEETLHNTGARSEEHTSALQSQFHLLF